MRVTALTLTALIACSGRSKAPDEPEGGGAASPAGATSAAAESEPGAGPAGDFAVVVDDPAALAVLAAAGLGYRDRIGSGHDAVVATVRGRLRALQKNDSRLGVRVRGHPHRLFDAGWLDRGRFELVGATYRVDRIPLAPATCGDIRLIYRLSYTADVSGTEVYSRYPMTVALVFPAGPADAEGCAAEARRWRVPPGTTGEELGRVLSRAGGALDPARLRGEDLTQVLLNLQQVRWPSAVKPDLGGHAEYFLARLVPSEGGLEPAPLDMTPDLVSIRQSPALRERLVEWLSSPETLAAIDRGTARLPEELAARGSTSVSPRGFSRGANRLYSSILTAEELADLDLSTLALARTPAGLLRRLDEATCAGCHQSRTLAGFHWLGVDGPQTAAGNALAVHMSPPLLAERERRVRLVASVAAGEEPAWTRPWMERAPGESGGLGSPCGLGDDASFVGWTCGEDLVCDVFDGEVGAEVGLCVGQARGIGDACETAPIQSNLDPRRDRAPRAPQVDCRDAVCNGNRVGFPGGMCTASCSGLGDDGVCGGIALLGPFNRCVGRGTPFPECLANHVSPAGLRACDEERPCRPDYLCARTSSGQGGCIPPYFLFQMRVDGHP